LLQLSVSDLKGLLFESPEPIPEGLYQALETDARRGVRNLAARLRARQLKRQAEEQRLGDLLRFERELWAQGFMMIAGVDEAGIGPLAGPVIAGAVVLPQDYRLAELDDSKRLDESTRERLAERIKSDAVAWACGAADVDEIDSLNIYHAGLLAMRRAVEGLSVPPNYILPDYILVDARTIPQCSIAQRGIIRGDQLSASIAAASIIAKTTRDSLMVEIDRLFPGYGFASHKGYPTATHFQALREMGALPIHRRSFRPVREALNNPGGRDGND
jgi:ribonuclease HII